MEFSIGLFLGLCFGFFGSMLWVDRRERGKADVERPIVPVPPGESEADWRSRRHVEGDAGAGLDRTPHVYEPELPPSDPGAKPLFRVNGSKVDAFEFFGDDFGKDAA